MKHCLHLKDWSAEDIKTVINKAIDIKAKPEKYANILKNQTLLMLFQKGSTRTKRVELLLLPRIGWCAPAPIPICRTHDRE